MQKNLVTAEKKDTVFKAAELMSSHGISCLIIKEEEKAIGIITRRDILEKILLQKKDAENVKVEEIMTAPVISVNQNASLVYAAGIMKIRRIKQIPVTSEEKVVGIVTQTDIVLNINTILGFDEQKLAQ